MQTESDYLALYDAGWSQAEIAKKYGVSQSTVSRALRKDSKIHSMDPCEIDKLRVRAAL